VRQAKDANKYLNIKENKHKVNAAVGSTKYVEHIA
jgi:hypothetical protein